MKRAVFLDRDGVINNAIIKEGKIFSPRRFEDFKLVDGIKEVLEKLKAHGLLNIVVTNQPDITRGLMRKNELQKMHNLIRENLPIDDIFICPHDDSDNCNCRKPKPGLLLEAAKKWDIDLKNSFLIGDQAKDMKAGKSAGCTTILIDYPYNQDLTPDFRVSNPGRVIDIVSHSEECESSNHN